MFTSIYDEGFTQEIPDPNNTGGHVQVLFTYDGDSNTKYDLDACTRTEELYQKYTHPEEISYNESMLNMVLHLVENAAAEGYELRDIAILSRTNQNSKRIAN